MKNVGIVRKLDLLGRIVLPVELRRVMNIQANDSLAFFTEGDRIIIKKHDLSCVFCASHDDITSYRSQNVCRSCIKELKSAKTN